jgi:hypothetical protein
VYLRVKDPLVIGEKKVKPIDILEYRLECAMKIL